MNNYDNILSLNDSEFDFVDTRSFNMNDQFREQVEELPKKISGTYTEDYNILYIDDIIRKKLNQEKYTVLPELKTKYKQYNIDIMQKQTYIKRDQTLRLMEQAQREIEAIESGSRLAKYNERVRDLIASYKKYSGPVKTVVFDLDDEEPVYKEISDEIKQRLYYIEEYINIASEYMELDIVRMTNRFSEICLGCSYSLAKVPPNEDGVQRCPKCMTDHDVVIMVKLAKDGARINTNTVAEDESIHNFLQAFIRYQGLHSDTPSESLYEELDLYFERQGRPSGDEIKKLSLTARGRRGDTNHKMLWNALSQIGCSDYYEDANYIGHKYWGWTLPDVMYLRERIIDKYIKTQKGFYQIPPEERCRSSSLGTQYRLWRHLQLEGHECYIDEFKIAENPESLRIHNKLWRLMCEACNDPDIYYIE